MGKLLPSNKPGDSGFTDNGDIDDDDAGTIMDSTG